MYWTTMLGIALITAGTILPYFAHNIKNTFDDKYLQQSISGKAFQIDENSENISGKSTITKQVEVQVDEPNIQGLKRLTNDQVKAQVNRLNASASEKLTDKQIETSAQTISKPDFSDIIAQARKLCDEGKYDEAYRIADDLRQKQPDFGLAYSILGTIEMYKKHYDKGEELLNRAIHLRLPNEDMAWAFHNLGISSARKENIEKAKECLEKAVKLNSDMEISRKALKSLNDHLQKKHAILEARKLYDEGEYYDAYNIVDDLRQRHPDFGLTYFILGMIEIRNEHYDKGEERLNQAVQLGLPDEDMAWAFHNLGTSSLKKKDFEQARKFLEKAVGLNPDMEESRKALNLLDDLQKKEGHQKEEGGN